MVVRAADMRRTALLIVVLLSLRGVAWTDDLPLPTKEITESPGADGLSLFPETATKPVLTEVYVLRLAGQLERMKRKASYAKYLYSEGVLAKAEQEENEVSVLRAERDLERARLDAARKEFEAQRRRAARDDIGKPAFDAAMTKLAFAFAASRKAADDCSRAELDLAVLNLRRQQKLYTTGAASRGDLRRAEARLANARGGGAGAK